MHLQQRSAGRATPGSNVSTLRSYKASVSNDEVKQERMQRRGP